MAKRKVRTEFEAGRGYSKEEWEAVSSFRRSVP